MLKNTSTASAMQIIEFLGEIHYNPHDVYKQYTVTPCFLFLVQYISNAHTLLKYSATGTNQFSHFGPERPYQIPYFSLFGFQF